jgi:hypothetical protein
MIPNSGERLSTSLPEPPNKQATARSNQAGQSSADAGTGDGNAIERRGNSAARVVSPADA